MDVNITDKQTLKAITKEVAKFLFKLKQETVKLNINNEMIQARIHSAGIENLHNSTEGGKYKMLFLCL